MKSLMLLLATLALLVGTACAAIPTPASCKGQANGVPLVQYDESSAVFLRRVTNGTLSSVMPSGATTPLLVLNVFGDSYSMGVAYGQLLTDELAVMVPAAYDYFSTKYHLPTSLVNELLDLTRNSTKAFTPKWHFDFLQGMADGTGGNTTFLDLWRVSMIPEAIKAMCSIAGAWDGATETGGLIQLRALDWGTDGPFQQWPLLATFHPDDGSFTHSSLGWVGMYGTLTGFSSSNLAVSEKVWYAYKKLLNIIGYPWTFMLHDIMRFDGDIDAAISRIAQGPRTCAIWVGLGQGARPNPRNPEATLPADFKLVADGFEEMHVYNPENFPVYPPQHTYFPNLIYVNKRVQPSHDQCMNDLFTATYGSLTPDVFRTTITAMEQTGDMHIAITDFDAKTMTIANAGAMPNNSPAYNNGFVQFNMTSLWATTPSGDATEALLF